MNFQLTEVQIIIFKICTYAEFYFEGIISYLYKLRKVPFEEISEHLKEECKLFLQNDLFCFVCFDECLNNI